MALLPAACHPCCHGFESRQPPRRWEGPFSSVPTWKRTRHVTRLAWVDRAKGIAILLVVLHHVIQFSADQQWASDDVIYANTMLQTFRMPLFFAMSGLFFQRAAVQSWRWLLTNRVLPFTYLYVIWTVVWHACFEVMPVERAGLGLQYLSAHLFDPGVGPWYIYALTLYFIAAKALSPLPPWSQLAIMAAVSVPVAARLIELPWAWEYICMYSLAFFAGMHGQRLLIRLADRTTWVTVVIAAAVWGFGTAGVYLLAWPHGRYLFIPLSAAGIILGVALAAFWSRASVLAVVRQADTADLPSPPAAHRCRLLDRRHPVLASSPCVVAGVLLCTWAVVVMAAIAIWRVSSVVPGLFVAPWYGAGNATMSRSEPAASDQPVRRFE